MCIHPTSLNWLSVWYVCPHVPSHYQTRNLPFMPDMFTSQSMHLRCGQDQDPLDLGCRVMTSSLPRYHQCRSSYARGMLLLRCETHLRLLCIIVVHQMSRMHQRWRLKHTVDWITFVPLLGLLLCEGTESAVARFAMPQF